MVKGMIIDGVAASEAIDSSGEILDVSGCDISDLEEGRGVLNYEHKSENDQGASFGDIIGRIIFAKKIFKDSDCANDRERFYWNMVKLPFIYIQVELFDQDGHKGASEAAANIRHYARRKLPILVRYSIEGVTVERNGNRLIKCIAKRIAATIKPCNKQCFSGVLEDPWDGSGAKKPKVEPDHLEELATSKFEHPGFMKLGGSMEIECEPELIKNDVYSFLRNALDTIKLAKTLTAGSYNAAPGMLTGGAALQREDLGHRALKNQAMAALRDWDRTQDFRKFLKFRLPEADPAFIDHFANLVDDYRLKKKEGSVPGITSEAEDHFTAPPEEVRPKFPPSDKLLTLPPPSERKPEIKQLRRGGVTFKNGVLSTAKGRFPVHIPSMGRSDPYFQIMYPHQAHGLTDEQRNKYVETVHKPWEKATKNWMILNEALRHGTLPEPVVYHAAMFSAMTPNTSVPMSELYFGHVMDMMHSHGFDPRKPVHGDHIDYLKRMISGDRLPAWNRDHYAAQNINKDPKPPSIEDPPQIMGMEGYSSFHPHMMELVHQHRDDGQAIVGTLMAMKNAWRHAHKQKKSPEWSKVYGFGPKVARMTALLMGAGNVKVNDRHDIRATFGLNPARDGDKLADLNQFFQYAENDRVLRALDQHFLDHHPAVQYAVNRFPEHFQGREHQAIGPAFWLNWLAIPHYEEARGITNEGFNEGAGHKPYWDAIRPQLEDILRKYKVHYPPEFEPKEDASFDFGENVEKHEGDDQETHRWPMAARTAHAMKEIEDKYGETVAHLTYYQYMLPALLVASKRYATPSPETMLYKMQAMQIDLSKAVKELEQEPSPHNVYRLYDTSDHQEKLIGRFSIHSGSVQHLEDHEQLLSQLMPEGHVDDTKLQALRNLPNHKLVAQADENAQQYDKDKKDEKPVVPVTVAGGPSYFEFRHRYSNHKSTLEVHGRICHLDGRRLEDDEASELMDNVRNGYAVLRHKPQSPLAHEIKKMETAILDTLIKAEPKPSLQNDTMVEKLGNYGAWRTYIGQTEDGVFIELDGNDFTSINDTHGFDAGDNAIVATGNTILDAAKEISDKAQAFRIYSDTFAVHLPTPEDAVQFVRLVRNKLGEIPPVGGTHNLTLGIGLGGTPEKATEALRLAKEAKYKAAAKEYKPGVAETVVYNALPGYEGLVPADELPPIKKASGDNRPLG